MADLADVTATLAAMAAAAVYPNGPTAASLAGGLEDVAVFAGWPIPAKLDAAIKAGRANVSIFPTGGGTGNTFQVLDEVYVIAPASHGMKASISLSASSATITVAGAPGLGEYLTIVADGRHAYSRVGGNLGAILSALQTDAAADYSGVAITGSSITLPTTRVVARIGAPAILGKATHRQKDFFTITTWAPTPQLRDALAAAIDSAFKATNRLTMPDTSQAILVFARSQQRDERETTSIYRRDLVYSVEYATLQTFQGWEITSANVSYDDGPSGGAASNVITTTTSVASASPATWILASGVWDDSGVWLDDATWVD